jgi:hypothetical protein
MSDLEAIIEDSLTDAVTADPVEAPTSDEPVAEGVDSTPTEEAAPEGTEAPVEASSSQVPSPSANQPKPEEDEFAKKFGLPQQVVAGRENRIPYSRVKKIVERAEKEAIAKAQKDFDPVAHPKFVELDTKVKDYEGRLERVAQFEQVMTQKPQEFLQMLSQVPAYKEFFDFVRHAVDQARSTQSNQPAGDTDPRPEPDVTLEDGTAVYSMEGLDKLQEWQARRIEAKLSANYEAKLGEMRSQYDPIRQRFEQEQQMARIVPQVQQQIAEARTWPQFNENEDAITKALQANPNLSLEGAYRQVVFPKLVADRDTMYKSVLEEVKRGKPTTTATPARGATRPNAPAPEAQSMEDIIRAKAREAGLIS